LAKRSSAAVAHRPRRFQQALGRRLKALDRDLPSAVEDDVEALHRARVASRRLREVLPVIEPESAEGRHGRRIRRRVRRLTRALGGVRELDVALLLLDELQAEHPDFGAGVAATAAEVRRERAGRQRDMIRRIDQIEAATLTADLRSFADLRVAPPVSVQRRRLRERVTKRAGRLGEAIDAAGQLYAFDRLHLVRIAVKQLRYALELVAELAGVGSARPVRTLKQAQDLLGRLHDLEVLAGYARTARVSGPDEETMASTSRLLSHIEQETHELHADYLHQVPDLRALVDTCRGALARRLA
jgi:CHAD domain-containing protein